MSGYLDGPVATSSSPELRAIAAATPHVAGWRRRLWYSLCTLKCLQGLSLNSVPGNAWMSDLEENRNSSGYNRKDNWSAAACSSHYTLRRKRITGLSALEIRPLRCRLSFSGALTAEFPVCGDFG
ncbi:hypothetical protein E2C01_048618 [Portunus trituberculatus]|uniref:Uncharacterized protein n=1 Tax=Portunus trituberculatus TaxID=210409 RepID=A0A5B7GDW9_PORTR|nr:hypothetical protein [Portunus trituberculatus]